MFSYILGETEITLPISWEEVTVDQFTSMRKIKNPLDHSELLSVLTGKPYELFFHSKRSDLADILSVLEFAAYPPDMNAWPMPSELVIKGKSVTIPQDLEQESQGQFDVYVQTILPSIETTGDILNCLSKSVAIYLQPSYTEKPFTEKLDDVIKDIDGCLLKDVYPIAAFFLKQYLVCVRKKASSLKVI